MKTNAYFNVLRNNDLAGKLTTEILALTKDFDFVLPRGWRFIAKIVTDSRNGTPPHPLFYLDIQADEGGGSWAEAKIQTMEKMNLAATQPLEQYKLFREICKAKLNETPIGKEICDLKDSALLTKEQKDWLVDINNGPGIAPNFGGLKLDTVYHFYKEGARALLGGSKWDAVAKTGTIEVAFSGAAAWQDLQFAACALRTIVEHFHELPNENFDFNFQPLEEIPEVKFWLRNVGLI